MLVLNGKKFALNDTEFTDSLPVLNGEQKSVKYRKSITVE